MKTQAQEWEATLSRLPYDAGLQRFKQMRGTEGWSFTEIDDAIAVEFPDGSVLDNYAAGWFTYRDREEFLDWVEREVALVGSRASAILRRFRLAVAPRFLWECLTSRTVSWVP